MSKFNTIDLGYTSLVSGMKPVGEGCGGTTEKIVCRPLEYPQIVVTSQQSQTYLDGTSNAMTITFKLYKGSYDIAKVELMLGGTAVATKNSPSATESFQVNGINSSRTYYIKATDSEGYSSQVKALSVTFGKKVYWGILESDNDALTESNINTIDAGWITTNCSSEVIASLPFEKKFGLSAKCGFAVIAVPNSWTNGASGKMFTKVSGNKYTLGAPCRKSVTINSVSYDVYMPSDGSDNDFIFGI